MSGRGRRVHDRDILDALESIDTASFEGSVWRITRDGRDPTRGAAANGRWSPTGEFEVLYTSLERPGALAEIGHRLSLEPIWPSRLIHRIHELKIRARRVLPLSDLPSLARLGVDISRYESYDYTRTQAIAAASQFLDYDAIMVPNARYSCSNLVILTENLDPDGPIEVLSSEIVDWSAWRRSRS